MPNFSAKNPERENENLEKPERQEKGRESGKKVDSKEIKEASKEFVEGVSEVVETTEGAEFVEGEVSEQTGEDKRRVSAGSLKGGTVYDHKASAIAEAPPIEIMQAQIATRIKKEIKILEKEAKRMISRPGSFSPFKLSGILAQIRNLKDILANLGYAAAETLKDWWLKFVKGIST